jgi:hypothetical protein
MFFFFFEKNSFFIHSSGHRISLQRWEKETSGIICPGFKITYRSKLSTRMSSLIG